MINSQLPLENVPNEQVAPMPAQAAPTADMASAALPAEATSKNSLLVWLALIPIGLALVGGYWWWQKMSATPTEPVAETQTASETSPVAEVTTPDQTEQTSPASVAATPDATTKPAAQAVALKTATLEEEKITFQYPENWKVQPVINQERKWSAISPNNFQLQVVYGVDGLGGFCDEECKQEGLPNKVLGSLRLGNKNLYVVMYGLKKGSTTNPEGYVAFSVLETQTCDWNMCYGFEGKNLPGIVMISGQYVNPAKPGWATYVDPEEFATSADVKTAVEIVKSMRYVE